MSSVSPERCDDDRRPAGAASERDRLDRLGQRADLVELDEDGVGGVLLDRPRDPLGVGDEQVVADQLDGRRAARSAAASRPSRPRPGRPRARRSGSARPSRPTGRPARPSRASGPRVPGRSASARPHRPCPPRPARVVAGSRAIATSIARPVAGLLDRPQDQLDRGLVRRQRRREAALVALAGRVALIVEDAAQGPEDLGAGPQRFGVRPDPDRHDHELLEIGRVLGVLAAIEDVEHRDWQVRRADAAEIAVEREVVGGGGRVGTGQRDAEERVRAEPALVRRAVELDAAARRRRPDRRRRARAGPARSCRSRSRPRAGRPCHRSGAGRRRGARPPRGRRSRRRMAPPLGRRSRLRTTSTSTVGLPRESRDLPGVDAFDEGAHERTFVFGLAATGAFAAGGGVLLQQGAGRLGCRCRLRGGRCLRRLLRG